LRFYYVGADGQQVNCRFAGPNGFLTQQPSRYSWQALQAAEVLTPP
jgi:hypothetical protein